MAERLNPWFLEFILIDILSFTLLYGNKPWDSPKLVPRGIPRLPYPCLGAYLFNYIIFIYVTTSTTFGVPLRARVYVRACLFHCIQLRS